MSPILGVASLLSAGSGGQRLGQGLEPIDTPVFAILGPGDFPPDIVTSYLNKSAVEVNIFPLQGSV